MALLAAQADRKQDSTVRVALRELRSHAWGIVLISAVVNILMFAGPLYMLQVYDRVLASRSLPTLAALTLLLVVAYAFQALLDIIRNRIVVRGARLLDAHLSAAAYGSAIARSLRGRPAADAIQPSRDLDTIRGFLSGPGPTALMDLPWSLLFIGVCFLIHPWIGIGALLGMLVLLAMALATEWSSRSAQENLTSDAAARHVMLDATRRHAESIRAMGMVGAMKERWHEANQRFLDATRRGGDITGGFSSATRALRLLIQSALLGLGAWLVLRQEMTGGAIIAGSIIAGRALTPVEAAIANWRGFTAARHAVRRLRDGMADPAAAPRTALGAPIESLQVEALAAGPPETRAAIIVDIAFALAAGEALGVIGPSAAGKTSLGRALTGIWPPLRGAVRLDGADLDHWDADALGAHLGYLPQSADLFDGTVAENIARMSAAPDADAVIAAARAAGAHEIILQLPQGYDTRIGDAGIVLSAGQRQRIGLARALFGEPFLVVLDEPNANLDAAGEAALTQAIQGVKARGGIAVVIAHRPSALAACEKVLVMAGGRMQSFGPRDEVLRKVLAPAPSPVAVPVSVNVTTTSGKTIATLAQAAGR